MEIFVRIQHVSDIQNVALKVQYATIDTVWMLSQSVYPFLFGRSITVLSQDKDWNGETDQHNCAENNNFYTWRKASYNSVQIKDAILKIVNTYESKIYKIIKVLENNLRNFNRMGFLNIRSVSVKK